MIDFSGFDKRIIAIKTIKELNYPIFIYGAGCYSDYVIKYLKYNGIDETVSFVVDDVYKKPNDNSITISEYLSKWADSSVLIIGFFNYNVVQKKILDYSDRIRYLFDFRINCVNDKLLTWNKENAEKRLPQYQITYDLLTDEKSKKTMDLFLQAAVNGEFDEFWNECYEEDAYFNSYTIDRDIDLLVDCGAYDGKEIIDYSRSYPDYKKIIAIEPDLANVTKLKKNLSDNNIRDVEIIEKGVYKTSGTLSFSAGEDEASHICEDGDISIPVIALDELLSDYDGHICIKMDIEGCELEALEGAKNTIVSSHPDLAICVYHKEEDLILIPQYINSLVPKGTYSFYLGFHGFTTSELIFYALKN